MTQVKLSGENDAVNLNQTAEYALRAMARLAAVPEGEAMRASDLATETAIPQHYVSKILRQLVVAGLLEGRKGHGGGFRLARPAERITFRDVLEAVGSSVDPAACAFGWASCDPVRPCPLHPAWARLKESLDDWASTTTLAEVAGVAPKHRGRRRRPARKRA